MCVKIITKDTILKETLKQIQDEIELVPHLYKGVVNASDFIIEQLVGSNDGSLFSTEEKELAVDMFYNTSGDPVITNIVHHPY